MPGQKWEGGSWEGRLRHKEKWAHSHGTLEGYWTALRVSLSPYGNSYT